MKMRFLILLICTGLLIGCEVRPKPAPSPIATNTTQPTAIPQPTNTPAPTPPASTTKTATSTHTPTTAPPTSTPTLSPSATPTPTMTVIPPIELGIADGIQLGLGDVFAVDYLADEKTLLLQTATGSYTYDPTVPEQLPSLLNDGEYTLFSPSGNLALVGSKVIDMQSGQLLFETTEALGVHSFFFRNMSIAPNISFSPDDKLLGLGTDIVNAHSGETIARLDAGGINATFSPDGQLYATATNYGQPLYIYRTSDWSLLFQLDAIFNDEKGNPFVPLSLGYAGFPLATASFASFSADNQHLIVSWGEYLGGYGAYITVHNRWNGTLLQTIHALPEDPTNWSDSCDTPFFSIEPPYDFQPLFLKTTQDGNYLAVTFHSTQPRENNNDKVAIYNLSTDSTTKIFANSELAALRPDGSQITIVKQSGEVRTWSLPDLTEITTLSIFTGKIKAINFSAADNFLIVNQPAMTRIWDIAKQETIAAYRQGVVAIDSNEELLAVGYADGFVERRRLSDNVVLSGLKAHADRVNALTFMPDGTLVTAGRDCSMLAWDFDQGKRLLEFEPYITDTYEGEGRIKIVYLTPLSEQFVAGIMANKAIVIWDVNSGEIIVAGSMSDIITWVEQHNEITPIPPFQKLLPNYTDIYFSATNLLPNTSPLRLKDFSFGRIFTYSPDDTLLAVGGKHGLVLIWDIASGDKIAKIEMDNEFQVTAIRFSADSQQIAIADEGGIVRVYPIR